MAANQPDFQASSQALDAVSKNLPLVPNVPILSIQDQINEILAQLQQQNGQLVNLTGQMADLSSQLANVTTQVGLLQTS
jgi:hypothetical protein